jgi:uncharacterized oligopeptide transporter (OPT) family protein
MKFISIGTVLFFLFSTFSKKFEANWTIFLAIPVIYLSVGDKIWEKKWVRNLTWVSFGIVVVARLVFLFSPDQVPVNRLKEFHGWKAWSEKVKDICGTDQIVANTYQVASKLSFYLNHEINALNYHSRKNQFDYWRFDKEIPTKEVCYVTDKKEFVGEILATPEGKNLRIVKNESLERLWALKYSER